MDEENEFMRSLKHHQRLLGLPPAQDVEFNADHYGMSPDCVGRLMGFRYFRVVGDTKLLSLSRPEVTDWPVGRDAHAVCAGIHLYAPPISHREVCTPQGYSHPAPYPGCTCGLYAFYGRTDPEDAYCWAEDSGIIGGVVSAHGVIEECTMGFRAQYMRVEALVMPYSLYRFTDSGLHDLFAGRWANARNFSRVYRVPLIDPLDVHDWMDDFPGGVALHG